MATESWRIWRIEAEAPRPVERDDEVVVELPLEIRVNGIPLVALMRTPGMDKELAVGFCLTERIIRDFSQVKLLRHCGQLEREVDPALRDAGPESGDVVELEVEGPSSLQRFSGNFLVRTGCGGADIKALAELGEIRVTADLKVSPGILFTLAGKLEEGQEVFPRTGGTHGAAVFRPDGTPVVVAEDVGRHNALDKAVGWCAMRKVGLADKVLFISGRISYEMALKAARVGVPVLASVAAPTSLGLRLAKEAGLTLVGFCGNRRFNLYTHPWRIT